MNGVERQFETVGDAELVENVVKVVFYGLLANEELFPDFLVAEALGNELHNLFFAVAEQRLFAAWARLRGFGEGLHDLGGHAIVEPDFASMNAMNGFDEQIGGGLLQDHAASAEAHGANDIAIIFSGREDDDAGRKRIEVNFLKDGKAVFIGHTEIEQENVGLELRKHLDAFSAILRFSDDGNVFVRVEEFAETVAKNSVVIGEEHTNLLFSRLCHDLAERNFDGKARTMTRIGLHGQHAPHGTRTLLDGNGTQPETVKFIPGELAGKAEAFAVIVNH
jgi:hypothetical protein